MVSPRGDAGRAGHSEGFRLSPGLVFLAIALVLSVVYGIYALTVRDTSQIPLLASGAVVVGIAFGALALYSLSAVWRAGTTVAVAARSCSGSSAGSRRWWPPGAWPWPSSCSCSPAPPERGLTRVLLHSAGPAPIV